MPVLVPVSYDNSYTAVLDVTDFTSPGDMVVSGGINSVRGHERCTSLGQGDIPTRHDDAAISFHSQRSNIVVE